MSKTPNIGIHGFNEDEPKETVGKLANDLEAFILFNYGWRGLIGVIFTNKRHATELYEFSKTIDIPDVYAHSNGAAIAVEAARQGMGIKNLVLINPALKRNTVFPDTIERVIVIYTKHDVPTKAAQIADKIPVLCWFVCNAWGAMGREGALTSDPKVVNFNASYWLKEHSDFFEDSKRKIILKEIEPYMAA